MTTLRFIAEPKDTLVYDHSQDPPLSVHGGETFDVSEEVAEELLTNPFIPVEEDQRREELSKLKRDELNTKASDAGIENPEGYASKDALVEALMNPPPPAPESDVPVGKPSVITPEPTEPTGEET